MWTAISVLFMALSSSGTLVLPWGNFAHRGHLAMFKHIFQLPQQGLLLASTELRGQGCCKPSFKCTGQAPPTKNDLGPNANAADVDEPAPDLSPRLFLVISFISSPNRTHGLQEVPPSSLGGDMKKINQDDL